MTDHGWVINWTIILGTVTAIAGFVVKVIVPEIVKWRAASRDPDVIVEERTRRDSAGVASRDKVAALGEDLARLDTRVEAETQRQTEWRVEMRQLLLARTPMFAELTHETGTLAEELRRLVDITKAIGEQVNLIELRGRGQEDAIKTILDTAARQRGKR